MGKDVFVFDTISGIDTISGFKSVDDTIWLDQDSFSALGLGNLSSAAFAKGVGVTAALDASDRILYDTSTGNLYYDHDGVGGDTSVQIAALIAKPFVGVADFMVV